MLLTYSGWALQAQLEEVVYVIALVYYVAFSTSRKKAAQVPPFAVNSWFCFLFLANGDQIFQKETVWVIFCR
jgi:hypothetical protein